MPHTPIYKIMTSVEWAIAQASGFYAGSVDDQNDGFIHFSAPDQVAATAEKHFAGQDDLMLVSVEAGALGEALKWEPSRGGALFPHLYGPLDLGAVIEAQPLPLGDDGRHQFPESVGN